MIAECLGIGNGAKSALSICQLAFSQVPRVDVPRIRSPKRHRDREHAWRKDGPGTPTLASDAKATKC
jgi:hypothetical protein